MDSTTPPPQKVGLDGAITTPESKSKHRIFRPRKLEGIERKYAKIAFGLAIGGILAFLGQLLFFTKVYSYSDWLVVLVFWIVFIMPGYLADAGMLIWGGGPPMDGGRVAKDGRRLFGPGKTWRGFFGGALGFGAPIALLIHGVIYVYWPAIVDAVNYFLTVPDLYIFYSARGDQLLRDLALFMIGDSNAITGADANMANFLKLIPRVVLCSFGAPLGDLVKSYAKRRHGLERGEPWWFLDQVDFVFGCLLLSGWFVFGGFANNWIVFTHVFIMLFIITPTITVSANTISYLTGHKKVPW